MSSSKNYKIVPTPYFEKVAKKLVKKYSSLNNEIEQLKEILVKEPFMGTLIAKNVYKIRIAVKSKGKGKRGGARVIINVKIISSTVYMLSIYSKGEKDDITDKELKELLKEVSE